MLLVKDTKTTYGVISVALHWYIALTIFYLLASGQAIKSLGAHGPLRPFRETLGWWHISLALTMLPFVLFRIYWRVRHGKPKTHKQHWALTLTANAVWMLLLAAMLWQMVTGPLLQLSRPSPFHWFGMTILPAQYFPSLDPFFTLIARLHYNGGAVIAILLALHLAGVTKHVLISRDAVLRKMVWPVAPAVTTGVEAVPATHDVSAPSRLTGTSGDEPAEVSGMTGPDRQKLPA